MFRFKRYVIIFLYQAQMHAVEIFRSYFITYNAATVYCFILKHHNTRRNTPYLCLLKVVHLLTMFIVLIWKNTVFKMFRILHFWICMIYKWGYNYPRNIIKNYLFLNWKYLQYYFKYNSNWWSQLYNMNRFS